MMMMKKTKMKIWIYVKNNINNTIKDHLIILILVYKFISYQ